MAEPLPHFVERRRPDWSRLEALLDALDAGRLTLGQIAELDGAHRRATADLARAAAWYPGTDAQRYLHQLCARAYQAIYRRRPDRVRAVGRFFRAELPALVRESWRFIAAAAALLLFGAVLGGTALAVEPGLAVTLVPANVRDYVSRGALWTDSLLEYMPPSAAATMILTNNLQVTFAAFGFGVTFGLGTALVLVQNGLQLAAIVAHCARGGLAPGILTFMAAHGPVELSIICISGGAGLMIGHALVAPGEVPRGEALRHAAARAVRLILGCAPFLAGIGVVEGFVSPGSFFSPLAKVVLGASLFLGFWTYLLRAGRER